jgi:hypothetical protein
MKKLVIAAILILGLSTAYTYAQEEGLPTDPVREEMQIQIQEEGEEDQEEEQTEETGNDQQDEESLSEELQIQQSPSIGFISILFALLTPALLIVVAYLLIKMSKD